MISLVVDRAILFEKFLEIYMEKWGSNHARFTFHVPWFPSCLSLYCSLFFIARTIPYIRWPPHTEAASPYLGWIRWQRNNIFPSPICNIPIKFIGFAIEFGANAAALPFIILIVLFFLTVIGFAIEFRDSIALRKVGGVSHCFLALVFPYKLFSFENLHEV